MTDTEISYYAGIFDGEGSILIYKRKTLNLHGVTVPYQMRVTVTNTHQGIIRDLHRHFKGCVYEYQGSKRKAWKWTAQCKAARFFLATIHPYLRIKRTQADVALEFQTLISGARHRKHPGFYGQPPICEQDMAKRDALANKLLELRKPI